jgi:hypothetical protein
LKASNILPFKKLITLTIFSFPQSWTVLTWVLSALMQPHPTLVFILPFYYLCLQTLRSFLFWQQNQSTTTTTNTNKSSPIL